jgi:DNA-binding CsgD family transcriptional regulator
MSGATREATVVVLLDWQGRLVWSSSERPRRNPGGFAGEYVRDEDREMVAAAVQEVVAHRRNQDLQVVGESGDHYRVWLWPLDSPDVAVCALCIHVPDELALLTNREQDCLKLLAHGMSAGAIADKLQIAVSTVHTHFKRAREKLKLPTLEALISFAARYSDTFPQGPHDELNNLHY